MPAEAGAASNTKYNDDPIGNGPFMLSQPWQHDKSITLVRNPNYTDGPTPLLDKVELTINDGSDSSFEDKGVANGDFDYARVSPDDLKTYANKYYSSDQAKNAFIKYNTFGINYLLVHVKNAPLNDVRAREAVSYAIDRKAIVEGVLKNSVTPATSLVSPPFASQGTYQPGICASCVKQDPAKAKDLAKAAGFGPGTKVNISFNTGAGHEGWVQAVAGELSTVLGWKVNIQPGPFKELLQKESDPKASGLYRAAWSADYPTSWDFIEPLLGTQPATTPVTTAASTATRRSTSCSQTVRPRRTRASGPTITNRPRRSPSATTWRSSRSGTARSTVRSTTIRGCEPRLLREPDAAHHRAQVVKAASAGSSVKAGPADAVTRDCSGVA